MKAPEPHCSSLGLSRGVYKPASGSRFPSAAVQPYKLAGMARTRSVLSVLLLGLVAPAIGLPVDAPSEQSPLALSESCNDATVLILGGGVAGVIAARTLHEQGIDDFVIVEAREELGGRLMAHSFGAADKKYTVELGANWVQGTQTGDGTENPIWALAKKHNISTHTSDYFSSICTSLSRAAEFAYTC